MRKDAGFSGCRDGRSIRASSGTRSAKQWRTWRNSEDLTLGFTSFRCLVMQISAPASDEIGQSCSVLASDLLRAPDARIRGLRRIGERAAAGSSVSWLGSAGSRPIESQPHRRSRSRRRTAFVARPQSPASPLPRYEPRRQFRATAVLLRERVAVCALWGVPLGSLWCSRLLPARCPPVCWFSTIHP